MLLVHLVLATLVAWSMAPTTDETTHLDYGKKILRRDPGRTPSQDSKMPVSALNAAPAALASVLDQLRMLPDVASRLRDLRMARLVTVCASLLLGFLIYRWSTELYGVYAGRVALLLFAFCPTLLAHGTLVTTDLYASLAAVAASYCFYEFLKARSFASAGRAALVLAVSQVTKFSSAYLLVLQLFMIVCLMAVKRRWRLEVPSARMFVAYAALVVLLTVGVLQVSYLGYRPFNRLADLPFQSRELRSLQTMPVLSRLPLPLPYAHIQGLDMMREHERSGFSFGSLYLLGEVRRTESRAFEPFRLYYAVSYLFKEPIALQVLLLIGLCWVARHRTAGQLLLEDACVLVPMFGYFILLSITNKAQIGVRHMLPVIALSLIPASAAFASWKAASRRRRVLLVTLLAYVVVSVLSYFPHMIPYMNELVGDRKRAYRIVADSNLSWGQNQRTVDEFLRQNPDVILNPETPTSGRILVDVNHLVGVTTDESTYAWLREPYRPVRHIGYAHLLFEVPH